MFGNRQTRHCGTVDVISRSGDARGTHIRASTGDDLAAIVACSDLAFAASSGPGFPDSEELQPAESLKSQILDKSIRVICDATQILGYISLWPTAGRMFIDTLAVLPDHRRRGLGSKLLAFADLETLRLGLEAITLFTKVTMAGNLQFYQRRGYRETGRCNDDGLCRVFYMKRLSR